MSRIFASLAVVAMLLLMTALVLGLNVGDYNETCAEFISVLKSQPGSKNDRNSVRTTRDDSQRAEETTVLRGRLRPYQERAVTHKLMAVLAALVAVLVNCISITYFIGTNRWCQEVVNSYQLDRELIKRSNQIKRRTFPWSLLGILVVLIVIALGAACDPANQHENTLRWVQPHLWASYVGMTFVMISFVSQWSNIQIHSAVVETVLEEVRRIRLVRGLGIEE